MNGHTDAHDTAYDPTYEEWLTGVNDIFDDLMQQMREAYAFVCPKCDGQGGDYDRSTGVFATCPGCIEQDKCPRCLTDMRVEYDREDYPIDATCPACGFVWGF